ncbi:pca operon transcription factor PcaQ [Devosia sp.]|uniref:pca operon transcription factor PcaQ n=1 Tax=Devosia sp. TaxID=1871048 RepID=UPI002F21FD1E
MASLLDPRIKLRHLTCFVEVTRRGGVARAGSALGMSQPAVSKAIAELEAILGVALFDRSRRALALTAHGEMFLRFATAGLATLRQGADSVAEALAGTGMVAFGALPTVAAGIVPLALKRFAASPLACRTLVESGPSQYLLELLRTAAISFVAGRMASPEAMQGLSFEHLYSEELAFVVRPGHPLAEAGRLDLRAMADFEVLLPPRRAIIRPEVDALLLAAGVGRFAFEIETVSNSLGRSYVLLGDAVWIISRGVVARDLATGVLRSLPVDAGATLGPVGITTRTGAELTLPAQAMLAAIRQAAALRA